MNIEKGDMVGARSAMKLKSDASILVGGDACKNRISLDQI